MISIKIKMNRKHEKLQIEWGGVQGGGGGGGGKLKIKKLLEKCQQWIIWALTHIHARTLTLYLHVSFSYSNTQMCDPFMQRSGEMKCTGVESDI